MNEQVKAIRAEIKRRAEDLNNRGFDMVANELKEVVAFLDSLPEEKPEADLEEAAEKYRRESYKKAVLPNIDGPMTEYGGNIKDAFKAGAQWQKGQMLENAVEIEVKEDAGGFPIVPLDAIELYDYEKDKPLAKAGDKVKLIIIKKEN